MSQQQRTVLVTGGGGGLGRVTSVAFANAGYDVAVNYAHSLDDANATAAAVRACGRQALPVQADVSDDQAVRGMLAEVVGALGGLDVLVNNAGTTRFIKLTDLEAIGDDDWDRLLSVNLKGPFYCARAAAPHLRERRGSIINVATNSAFRPTGSSIPYMTSKAGVVMLTRCLAQALGPEVRTNAVAPGWLDTPWVDKYVPAEVRAIMFGEGAPPPADLEDIARAVLMLAEAPSINGQTLVIDRGQLMR
jgi:3-oxoacyl-[acyl-carrier protein] reductase